jgi:glyoxylase-like metal-dependent hydrolase (beta-lactamase superfamily II)
MPRMTPSRRRRVLLGTWLGLFALLVAGVVFVRAGRHKFDAPEPVRGSVVRVHAQVSDFYAARADGRVLLFDAGADLEGRGLDAVLALPLAGHTPGSMIYFYDGVLFAGDSMSFERDKLTSAFAPFSVDTQRNRENIAALPSLLRLADVKVVCTAHFGCTPESETRRMLDAVIEQAKSS